MAGAWAESGSLPRTYFEVFEWTEARALPPKYKLSGPKSPAAAQKVYSTVSILKAGPLLSHPPITPRLHASLNFHHLHPRLHQNPRASVTFRPPLLPLLGTQPPPEGPLPDPAAREVPSALGSDYSCRALPHSLLRIQALPGAQTTRSAVPSRPLPSK